jgi:hypothetical protein
VNDRPDHSPSADDTPELAEVRRLLADARHDEPMPADVAARMSRVIDRLGDQTPAARPAPRAAEVISISAGRRRRVAGLLAAAAAIVVGGVVIQNVHLSSHGSSAASSAGAESQPDQGVKGNQPPSHNPGTPTDSGPEIGQEKAPVQVHPKRFTSDAMRARQLLRATAYAALDATDRATDCVAVPRHARAVRATYELAPAALVFHRPRGGSQVVDLYVCHSTEPIRSTTLSVP